MNHGLNRVQLIGQLGAEPVYRSTPTGTSVTTFSVATNESWKDKESGERKVTTEWHNVVTYRNQADIAKKFLKKGSRVFIEGPLKTRKWQDKNGTSRTTTEVLCRDLLILDRKEKDVPHQEDDIDIQEIDNFGDDIPF